MPETIDYPPSRGPRRLLILVGIVAVIFFGGTRALSYYVSGLWFGSLGYASVFRRMLGLQWILFAVFAGATFALLYGAFLLLQDARFGQFGGSRALMVNGQPLTINVRPYLRPVALLASLFFAFVAGSSMMDEWPAFARFLYGAHTAASAADPVLGKPVTFYLLTLPVWQLVSGWLLIVALLALVMAVLLFVLRGRSTLTDFHHLDPDTPRYRGLAIAVGFLLLNLALRAYLGRFDLLLGEHTVFSGVTFVDAHVILPGMLLVSAVWFLGACVAFYSSTGRAGARWLAAAALPGVLVYLGVQLVGLAVSTFIVKPNELVKEQPYIRNNIEFTRSAYALDSILLRPFSAGTTVASADAAGNQETLQNIRLWDWHALQDTLRQIQEIRTYYDFPGIDIDRYNIGGTTREVMLATRELSVNKLPESSRNWINEKLIYTHGYGITMNPVNGFTPEGLPTLLLSNMPVQSTVAGLTLTRPEIYFGEMTDTDVYVKTRQKEFDYPQGQSNSVTSYDGTGGIVLGSWLHRTLIAFERGDLAKLPFSDDVSQDSRLLMRRNIRDRVQSIAPFLTLDPDPYIVVSEDGRLSWMMDAYTTSDMYPYARHYGMEDGADLNYVRNSVKIVVDAYDGSTTFYVFDTQDPILTSYRNAFPGLFKDAAAMPVGLRQHLRYPDLLLKLQAQAYSLYHMTDPETFFNREDLWTPATESSVDPNGDRSTREMEPNFVLMRLPDEKGLEFVNILPFTPANRNNLIGWIAGRSDGEHYGKAVVYNFPKTRLVDGPLQVEARIDQNAQISGQLTLWNQQGSHVRRGNLLVIPTGGALLYSESIYLQADRSPMPELRLVVLALQDRLAYGTTFEAAMAGLFGGAESSVNATAAAPEPAHPAQGSATVTTTAAPVTLDRNGLIQQAAKDLSEYQRLTADGKLADAGSRLEQLKRALDELAKAPR